MNLSRRSAIAMGAAAMMAKPTFVSADETRLYRRGYASCRFGQIHYHVVRPADPAMIRKNPIGCLHPSPASGKYYLDLLNALGRDRVAYAFDTPGFGESDRPPSLPTIGEYASALSEALGDLSVGPIDLLGYHTGCSIAVETSLLFPEQVRKLCLVGIPYFDTEAERNDLLQGLSREPYNEDGDAIVEDWRHVVKNRPEGVSFDVAVDLFKERMRADYMKWWGYDAAFRYPVEDRYSKITHPTVILNPHGGLYEETLSAAAAIPGAVLIDIPELSKGVFQVGSDRIAELAADFLDS